MDPANFVFLGVTFLLAIGLEGARRRRREHLRRIESRVDVLVQQLGLDDSVAPALSAEVRLHADRGELIQAIRLHREENPGLGLKEARDQIDAFGRGLFAPARPPDAARIVAKLDRVLESFDLVPERKATPEMPADVVQLALEGRKIEAIKRLREQRPDLGLKQAKQIVEEMAVE